MIKKSSPHFYSYMAIALIGHKLVLQLKKVHRHLEYNKQSVALLNGFWTGYQKVILRVDPYFCKKLIRRFRNQT